MNCEVIFDLDQQQQDLEKIEKTMADAGFWQKSQEEISRLNQQRVSLMGSIEQWQRYARETEDARLLAQMAMEEGDDSTLKEVERDMLRLEKELQELELQLLLGEPDDRRNAIAAINAGAGGTEAQDWVEMLLRMYLRWCEARGFTTRILDYLPGDEAGVKNVTFTVNGAYAYGFLKSEHGIHRMVRITHIPTGIVVQCQNEKSQHRNKDMAMKILKARLYDIEKGKQEEKKHKLHDTQKEIAWGSQIRSYVFNPYRLVKDHRTNVEVGNLDSVMDGGIDPFIDAYLRMK